MTFLDTSLLVGRYAGRRPAGRAGPDPARGGARVCVSDLVRVELPSAVWRRVREGALDPDRAAAALAAFAEDLPLLLRVPVDDDVLDRAAALVRRHPLRSLDAIQLASALAAAEGAPARLRFGTADARLAAAARAEGLEAPG